MLISASGAQLGNLRNEDVVFVDAMGHSTGASAPSSEWRFHRDILAARPEVSAVVHTHSVAATALACLRKEIPPFHYMVLRAGGHNVRCAGYATFGTQELSDLVVAALADRKACLLANHGMIAVGDGLQDAASLAGEIESLAELYTRALQIGEPILLTGEELEAAQWQFRELRYGSRSHGEPPAG
jgi:L-fuculose-phosphate aldolase